MRKTKQQVLVLLLFITAMCLTACGVQKEEDSQKESWNFRYKSDDCEVVSYLSVPQTCLEEKKAYPCIIYNRGGNRDYGANKPGEIAYMAETSQKVIFATQYRGVGGGTGQEEFGGDDLHDVHGLHPEDFDIIMEWCQ